MATENRVVPWQPCKLVLRSLGGLGFRVCVRLIEPTPRCPPRLVHDRVSECIWAGGCVMMEVPALKPEP